jgi:hypothetical protein
MSEIPLYARPRIAEHDGNDGDAVIPRLKLSLLTSPCRGRIPGNHPLQRYLAHKKDLSP